MTRALRPRVLELASEQHGVITRGQLLGNGLTSRRVGTLLERGELRRLHAGVYILGHLRGRLEPPRSAPMAAVLACGRGALISHGHAAALWELAPAPPRGDPVHVVVPGDRTPSRRPGIVAHRATDLSGADAADVDGVPVTTPGRTLADLAGRTTIRGLERAVARAERKGLVRSEDLRALLDRYRGRNGVERLRAVLSREGGAAFTRSEAEARFLDLIRGTGLPRPEVNAVIRGSELDFHWPGLRLAVEIDGYAYHKSRRSFAADRRRDARLYGVAGIRVLRFTWEQIVEEPKGTLVTLVRAIDRASGADVRGPGTASPDRGAIPPFPVDTIPARN